MFYEIRFLLLVFICFFAGFSVEAQIVSGEKMGNAVILPQRRVIWPVPVTVRQPVEISAINAVVVIKGNHAETRMEVTVDNKGNAPTEAELLFPVPADAVFKSFSYGEKVGQYPARLLSADEARSLYNSIVAQAKDPALMEFAGFGSIRTSVFPIAARSSIKLGIVYEQVLSQEGGTYRYLLPRTESVHQKTEWNIRVEIAGCKSGNVFCPSHETQKQILNNGTCVITSDKSKPFNPGSFRLTWSNDDDSAAGLKVFACPDREKAGSGYFMAVYGADRSLLEEAEKHKIRREITLVLDRSGSMRGEKMEQVRKAAARIIKDLDQGELFNIITYNEGVDSFSASPVEKSDKTSRDATEWLDTLIARGGTNISEALFTALSQPKVDGTLPLVLFLTDGLPTIGETSESEIIKLAETKNPAGRRIFTLGVGTDLNAPLLSRLSESSRAVPTFILPQDNVQDTVEELFQKLTNPLITQPVVSIVDEQGAAAPGRVRDMLPGVQPDLYRGGRLMVLGQYVGDKPFKVKLSGKKAEGEFLTEIVFDPSRTASSQDDFVPRLWAMRKVGDLRNSLQKMGADITNRAALAQDPKTREIIEEMINLSLEFGIMTEFTSFFADDGASTRDRRLFGAVAPAAQAVDGEIALGGMDLKKASELSADYFMEEKRDGLAAVAKSKNIASFSKGEVVNAMNVHTDEEGKTAVLDSVRQIGSNSYYKQGGVWVENTLKSEIKDEVTLKPRHDRVVVLGTPEYAKVVDLLVKENRQGILALDGDVNLRLGKEFILLKNTLD